MTRGIDLDEVGRAVQRAMAPQRRRPTRADLAVARVYEMLPEQLAGQRLSVGLLHTIIVAICTAVVPEPWWRRAWLRLAAWFQRRRQP